jgi:hypothetical protein
MNVGELIKLLEQYPSDMLVVKDGHSDSDLSFSDINTVEETHVSRITEGSWRGDYEEYTDGDENILVTSRITGQVVPCYSYHKDAVHIF